MFKGLGGLRLVGSGLRDLNPNNGESQGKE